MEPLTSGTHWSVDPTGQRKKNRAGGATLRAWLELDGGEFAGGDIFTRRSTRRGASFALLARP